MIELPEALNLSKQLNEAVKGKETANVKGPAKPHKFCWFNGEPGEYGARLAGHSIERAEGFGIFAEIGFSNGLKLCVNDGVNIRLVKAEEAPKNYQLLINFADGDALVFTVAMYGGIILHEGDYDNEYYIKSRAALSPFCGDFESYYYGLLESSKPNLSAKAFLATEQRFPGIGNGVLQDILFNAHIHPKRKLASLCAQDRETLYASVVSTLQKMCGGGGRDTEKDIYGNCGGYRTLMSKNSLSSGCPVCGGEIIKEAYLGGSVYYCPNCQPLLK